MLQSWKWESTLSEVMLHYEQLLASTIELIYDTRVKKEVAQKWLYQDLCLQRGNKR